MRHVRPRPGSAAKREDVAPRVDVHASLCGDIGLGWRARVREVFPKGFPIGRAHVGVDLEGSVDRKLVRVRVGRSRLSGGRRGGVRFVGV